MLNRRSFFANIAGSVLGAAAMIYSPRALVGTVGSPVEAPEWRRQVRVFWDTKPWREALPPHVTRFHSSKSVVELLRQYVPEDCGDHLVQQVFDNEDKGEILIDEDEWNAFKDDQPYRHYLGLLVSLSGPARDESRREIQKWVKASKRETGLSMEKMPTVGWETLRKP